MCQYKSEADCWVEVRHVRLQVYYPVVEVCELWNSVRRWSTLWRWKAALRTGHIREDLMMTDKGIPLTVRLLNMRPGCGGQPYVWSHKPCSQIMLPHRGAVFILVLFIKKCGVFGCLVLMYIPILCLDITYKMHLVWVVFWSWGSAQEYVAVPKRIFKKMMNVSSLGYMDQYLKKIIGTATFLWIDIQCVLWYVCKQL